MVSVPTVSKAPAARKGRWVAKLLLAAWVGCACILPTVSHALTLNGSLAWNMARTETDSDLQNVSQSSFGQDYRINGTGSILTRRIASWSAGVGWRNDKTTFSGTAQSDQEVSLTDLNMGLVLLPETIPISLSVRRALVDNESGTGASSDSTNSTVSISTQIPMGRDPLSLTAYQTEQDTGTGSDTTSRLMSLSKRFHLGTRSRLNSSYQYSKYEAPSGRSTGHGGSLALHTEWSDRLTSNLFGNLTSRSSTTTKLAGGRSLFMSNSAGGSVTYRKGRELSGHLAYDYTENPQDQGSDLKNQILSGRGGMRMGTKTDLNANFAVRSLDLGATQLDTATAGMGVRYRPLFGWSTGLRVGMSRNQTSGAATSDRNALTLNGHLSARHELRPVQLSWGLTSGYSTSDGDFAEDRLTNSAYMSAMEKRLSRIRISGSYRFTDIRQSTGTGGMDPFTREHGVTLRGNLLPAYNVLRKADQFSATSVASVYWSRQYDIGVNVRNVSFKLEGKYLPVSSVTTSLGYDFQDNSSDLGGSDQIVHASASWSRPALQRGNFRLKGKFRQSYAGSKYESRQVELESRFDYSIGLLRVGFSADITQTDTIGAISETTATNLRLNIVRTF